ncbi:unnamed protein product [Protopolystoma xenopodis]|uniref:Uncharacterized protein n=1 Tax=Protopolystoma xenopodis TaxID=117903 RepID=A0A448X124_9PLAT|nr:unnamed protein product [Protopolystoma xenopodis]
MLIYPLIFSQKYTYINPPVNLFKPLLVPNSSQINTPRALFASFHNLGSRSQFAWKGLAYPLPRFTPLGKQPGLIFQSAAQGDSSSTLADIPTSLLFTSNASQLPSALTNLGDVCLDAPATVSCSIGNLLPETRPHTSLFTRPLDSLVRCSLDTLSSDTGFSAFSLTTSEYRASGEQNFDYQLHPDLTDVKKEEDKSTGDKLALLCHTGSPFWPVKETSTFTPSTHTAPLPLIGADCGGDAGSFASLGLPIISTRPLQNRELSFSLIGSALPISFWLKKNEQINCTGRNSSSSIKLSDDLVDWLSPRHQDLPPLLTNAVTPYSSDGRWNGAPLHRTLTSPHLGSHVWQYPALSFGLTAQLIWKLKQRGTFI